MTRKPIAFKITDHASKNPAARTKTKKTVRNKRKPQALPTDKITLEPENFDQPTGEMQQPPIAATSKITSTIRWGAIFMSAFTGLIIMWASVTFAKMLEELFARSPILGWMGTSLLALAGFAALAIILREVIGIFSVRKISKLQEMAEIARNTNDAKAAKQVISSLHKLYSDRDDLKWGLAALKEHDSDIIDGSDRINLAERDLLLTIDENAGLVIAATSRRVTLLTAVTPTAILDVLFVAAQNMRMLRQLSVLYGGRPGTFGTLKLTGMVISHLAVTGGLALTDNLIQQFVGKGVLGRLSARFGEGAVNGILTTRIGLSALDLIRPIPFSQGTKPKLSDALKNLVSFQISTNKNVKAE